MSTTPRMVEERAPATLLDRLPTIGGVLLLVLVLVTVSVAAYNRSLQAEVSTSQARLANAQTAANLDNTLIRMLAKAAADHGDGQIKAMLASNGITYSQASAKADPGPEGGK